MKVRFFYICLSLMGVAFVCLIYGFFVEPKRLLIRDVTIESSHYQGEALRIALLSDLHIGGRHVPPKRVKEIMEKLRAEGPDVILFAGDFISGHDRIEDRDDDFNRAIELGFSNFSSSKDDSFFGVLGNHDVWYDAETTTRLAKNKMNVLANEATLFGNLCIVGLEDADTQSPNADAFLDCPKTSNIIALMHSPDSFYLVPSNVAIAVAGHTHGGQINLPFIGRAVTATKSGKPYAYGKVQTQSGVPAFVTAGIGTSILPARFRSPPEIVLITLQQPG